MHTSVAFVLAAAFAVAQATSPPYSSHYSNGTSSLPPHSSTSSSHSSLPPSSIPSSSSHATTSSKSSYSSIPTKSSSVSAEPPVYTTYTTTTLCPVTYTRHTGSSVTRSTSYTTSVITVTSCKSGCTKTSTAPPPPPPTSAPVPPPSNPEGPVTVVTTITSFVKCSTPVVEHGTTKYYSTWLTPTYIPSTYVTTYTVSPPNPTPFCPPAVTVTETKYATVTIYGNGGHHGGNGGQNGGNGGQNGGNGGQNGGNGGNNGGNGGNNGGHGGDHTKTHKPTSSYTGPGKPSGTGTRPSGTGNPKPPAVPSSSKSIYNMPTLSAKAW